jgi:transposase
MDKQILKQGLGLDVSKDGISACYARWGSQGEFLRVADRDFPNTAKGFKELESWLARQKKGCAAALHILMEATGVYYEALAHFLHAKNYRVSVALPNKTEAFGRSLGQRSKTDLIDAQKLAQMSLERSMEEWIPPPPTMLKIKQLCRERGELLAQKTICSNRLHAKKHSHEPQKDALERHRQHLKFLKKQVKAVEKAIKEAVKEDPDLEARIEMVQSIPGVGLVTAAAIVGETYGFALFKTPAGPPSKALPKSQKKGTPTSEKPCTSRQSLPWSTPSSSQTSTAGSLKNAKSK